MNVIALGFLGSLGVAFQLPSSMLRLQSGLLMVVNPEAGKFTVCGSKQEIATNV